MKIEYGTGYEISRLSWCNGGEAIFIYERGEYENRKAFFVAFKNKNDLGVWLDGLNPHGITPIACFTLINPVDVVPYEIVSRLCLKQRICMSEEEKSL